MGAHGRSEAAGMPLDASGPIVPPELVPVLEQPARPAPASRWAVAGVVLAILLVAGVAWIAVRGLYVDSLLRTSLAAIEAAANDDIRALEPLVPAETAASPEFRAVLAKGSAPKGFRFEEPVFSGSMSANFTSDTGSSGDFSLRPAFGAFGEAVLEWRGPPFGAGTGRVLLTLEEDGWKVYYITVGEKGVSFAPEDAKATFGGG